MSNQNEMLSIGSVIAAQTRRPTISTPWPSGPPVSSSGCRPASDSTKACGACGETITTFPYTRGIETRWFWRTCPCREAAWQAEAMAIAAEDAAYRQRLADMEMGDTGMKRVRSFTLDTFDVALLWGGADHPTAIATAWLTDALAYGDAAVYRDEASPPAALYFYSPGKGRGKTHLAVALAGEAQAQGKLTTFVEESSYFDRRLSCDAREVEALSALPGTRAWLTVIDDLGQRLQGGDWVSDTWYALINRRWTKGGWTIFTSNRTPEELVKQRTINDATYSRLIQMIGKRVIFFNGQDQRLV